MGRFIVFVRGLNVGGHGVIGMAQLRKAVSDCGFEKVATYIQSGNVILESTLGASDIAKKLETMLSKTFGLELRTVVLTKDELERVLSDVPRAWKKGDHLRRYIVFVRGPKTVKDVAEETSPRAGVDSLEIGKKVLYFTTRLSGISKSGFSKLAGKKIYRDITVRNYTTVSKVFSLM